MKNKIVANNFKEIGLVDDADKLNKNKLVEAFFHSSIVSMNNASIRDDIEYGLECLYQYYDGDGSIESQVRFFYEVLEIVSEPTEKDFTEETLRRLQEKAGWGYSHPEDLDF